MSLLKSICVAKRHIDDDDNDNVEQLATWNKMIKIRYGEMYRQHTMEVNSICCDIGKLFAFKFAPFVWCLFVFVCVCLDCNLPRMCSSNNIQQIKYTYTVQCILYTYKKLSIYNLAHTIGNDDNVQCRYSFHHLGISLDLRLSTPST